MPDKFWMIGTEVLEKPLGDDAGEDEHVISAHLSLHGIAVVLRGSMQVLIAVSPLQRLHRAHPEVVSEGADDMGGLLEGELDFEPQAVDADNLQRIQGGISRHENASTPGWVNDQHKAYATPGRAPQEVTHTVVDASSGLALDGAGC